MHASEADDLSWIKNWAAVGDSFSAGIGYRVHKTMQSSEYSTDKLLPEQEHGIARGETTFARAKFDDVSKQVKALGDGSQDLVTITAGGNDALLTDILNECVFMWKPSGGILNDPCPGVLAKAQAAIDAPDFRSKADGLISSAKSKLKSDGHIYYVGYAQFFGQESNQCDSVTWYLTQDRRKQMNILSRNVNKAISDAVARAGPSVTFVDYDKYVSDSHGRFCEDDHPETNGNRAGLLFYEWYTDDNVAPTDDAAAKELFAPSLFTDTLIMNGTFEASIGEYIRQAISKNASLAQTMTLAKPATPNLVQVNATIEQIDRGFSVMSIPDGYGKIFHPRPNAHQLTADLVLYNIEANYAKKLGQEPAPEVVDNDTCPALKANTAPPSTTTSTSTHAPTSTPDPDATEICGTWYKVLFDHFEIYGAHFDEPKFTSDGEELKHELEGCGEVTKWSFKALTNDPNGFQWFASGNLPIGTKACVGRAVVSAGGAGPDGCTGAGN
nr:hypothetical protein B0A51_06264 [Rachicladosporium sp. CCFEE 5018]